MKLRISNFVVVNYFNNPQDPNVVAVAADVKKKRVHIKHMTLLLDIEKAIHAFYKANYKTCDVVDDDGVTKATKVARVVLKLGMCVKNITLSIH